MWVLDTLVALGPKLHDQMKQGYSRASASDTRTAVHDCLFILVGVEHHMGENFEHALEGLQGVRRRHAVIRPPGVVQLSYLSTLDAQMVVCQSELAKDEVFSQLLGLS